ncbi:hypothetical protein [Streptomyces sp. ODS28]
MTVRIRIIMVAAAVAALIACAAAAAATVGHGEQLRGHSATSRHHVR